MDEKQYYIYILTNKRHTVLYVGFTNNLSARVEAHKNKSVKGFTEKYNVDILVYFEVTEEYGAALAREKQIKSWVRRKKIELINSTNPNWKDLSEDI